MAGFISDAKQADDAGRALGGSLPVAVLFVDSQPPALTKLKEFMESNKTLQVDSVYSVQEAYTVLIETRSTT
jgi:hypothetical protein